MLALYTRETDDEDLLIEIGERYWEGAEFGRIHLPAGVEELRSAARRQLAGETLVAAVRTLLELREVDTMALPRVVEALRASDWTYTDQGAWKSNQSRRAKARLLFALHDDGFGRITVEVDRGPHEVVARDLLGWTTSESFTRAVRSVRWSGDRRLVFDDGARFDPAPFVVDIDHGLIDGATAPPALEAGVPGATIAIAVRTTLLR
ncbi:hypothetical protein [Curtobacterium sp. 9128]|uniref:hypothetical protein n=1 Tax=Curtobacterium sp. 9128 TaxID=1793722 RepID=UPI0011A71715|nr:hypothetical protein [Curtobacterium sp. 9128]